MESAKMATTKTPISTLNEYMFRYGQTPHYQIVQSSSGHDTIFKFVVTAGDVKVGCGRSKKEAKHNAAQKALDTLANSDSLVRAQLLLTSGVTSERLASAVDGEASGSVAVSPYAEKVNENSVGALAELCAQNQLDEPVYEICREEGPAHSKTFTMCCKVLTLKEQGVARTKKQAKQISAKLMIDSINEHLAMASPNLISSKAQTQFEKTTTDAKQYRAAIDGYCAIKDKDRGNTAGKNVSQTLSTSHMMLSQLYGHQLSTIRAYALNHTPKETLTMFADGHDISLSFTLIKSNQVGNVMCAASLSTAPELVELGEGPDAGIAEEMASINILRALMIMIAHSKEEG
ncbi:protein Loquacious-like isoform X2 [Hetaerina americana]|uniref:protein Loquacious-like isoform X2 n=1 Tax=Hetaerina americana TaxID=62018 RepID=UPI003A7F247A